MNHDSDVMVLFNPFGNTGQGGYGQLGGVRSAWLHANQSQGRNERTPRGLENLVQSLRYGL